MCTHLSLQMTESVLETQYKYTKMKNESNFGRLEDLTLVSVAQRMTILTQTC